MSVASASLRPAIGGVPRLRTRATRLPAPIAEQVSDPISPPISKATPASGVPFPVVALLVTMLVPRELEFSLGVALTPQRVVLLIFMPIALIKLFASPAIKPRTFDFLIIGAFAYFWFALFPKETLQKALQSGSSEFLEAVGGYVIARVYVRSSAQFQATVRLLMVLTAIIGVAAIAESLTQVHWIKNFASALSGAVKVSVTDIRLGMMRAAVTFDHPIHYGTFCVAAFALVWFSETSMTRRLAVASIVVTAAFFSLTSVAFIGIILVLAGAAWEVSTRHVPHRVMLTLAAVAGAYLALSLVANRSPERILSTTLVFDSDNAYYRLHIWEHGTANVIKNPWFGVSLDGNWERPAWMYSATVDHYWLVGAMSGGLPFVTLYIAGILLLLTAVHKGRHGETVVDRHCRYAWTAALLILSFVGTTVHFWREIEVLFTFILGLGGYMLADYRSATAKPPLPTEFRQPTRSAMQSSATADTSLSGSHDR